MKRFILPFLLLLFTSAGYSQTQRLAVLDLCARNLETDKENLASAIHMAEVAGMPYMVTEDISTAIEYPFILITSSLRDETLLPEETLVLKNYVYSGGILIAPFIKSTYYFDLFGISYTKYENTRYLMTWDTIFTHPELCWVNDSLEKKLPMADSDYSHSIYTRGYTAALASVLAKFEDNTAAITVNNYGSGKAYALGFELKDVVLRNLLNKDYNSERTWSNGFEPTTDMFLLFLRAVYTSNRTISVYKHTSPGNSTSALLITHDVDSRTGIDSLFYLSEWEANNGIKAHYFVTTHYFRDDWLSDFYKPDIFPKLRSILEHGHVIGSHSVGHFPDFAEYYIFPLGEEGNTQENYLPAYTVNITIGGTVIGELEVSRDLLNQDLGANVRSFRSGHLAFNKLLIDGMSDLNYAFNSSNSANDVLTNFPYRQRTGNSFSGVPTEVYEMPMTISDASSNFPISDTTIEEAVGNWARVLSKNNDNNAPTILLIHPNRKWKLESLIQLMDAKPASVIPYEFDAFGDYWLARRDLDFDYSINNDTLRIQFVNDSSIGEEQSLIITNGRNLTSIELHNLSGDKLDFQSEAWKENDLIITRIGITALLIQTASVSTIDVSDVTRSTAIGHGSITDIGATYPTQHGICWSTSENPTISDSHTNLGAVSATILFTSSLEGLDPYTTYYARAYATNSAGTSYGNEVTFTTLPEAANVSTLEVTNITSTSATGNGNITDLGAPNPIAYGVCWNTIGNPDIEDNYTDEGAATVAGPFTSSIASLNPNTAYYLRTYATNTAGTSYGDEVTFTTLAEPAIVSTLEVTDITATSATGHGSITNLGDPLLSAYGFCWNSTGNPTINDNFSDEGAGATLGEFSSTLSSLSSGTTYYVRAYATNAAGTSYGEELTFTTVYTEITWTGASSTDWSTASNWFPEIIPTSLLDVRIPSSLINYPVISPTTTANCANLLIESGASITLQSDDFESGSFIFDGSYSGTGKMFFQRFLNGNQWHLVGSPLIGQNISEFLGDEENAILMEGGNYSMKDYIESPDSWSADYTSETGGDIELGKAYSVKRTSDGLISLIGIPNNTIQNVSITRNDGGWNLLSNPFTSSIAATIEADAENNLLSVNTSVLDENYVALYIWDEDPLETANSNKYKIINQIGGDLNQHYLQVGQGFFVKSAIGGGSYSLSPAMQRHQTTIPFKSDAGGGPWTSIQLNAVSENSSAGTLVLYNESMSNGLDIGYDAGLLNSYPDFALYSRLLDDNGIDFGIQCLPKDYDQLIVPIGLDANAGELVSFTASVENLEAEYVVVLEDRVTNSYTNLSEEGAEYSIQLMDDISGTGRFYLHTILESTLGVGDLDPDNSFLVFARPQQNQLLIRGAANANTMVQIFSIVGRRLTALNLNATAENVLPFHEESGIYIVKISNEQGSVTKKFTWVK